MPGPPHGGNVICAIVLAAGESRRMGAQGLRQHKMLLPFRSTTVIGHIVDQLLHSVLDRVLVIVGHERDSVARELSRRAVTIVVNPDYQSGMLSSVRCGLQALPQSCRRILVALGDQPAITSELIDDLLRAFAKNDKGIAVPVFRGKRGHPILFSARYREEVLTHFDDVGLRGLLHAHQDDVLDVAASSASVLSDMDYPEDYQRELAAIEERDALKGA